MADMDIEAASSARQTRPASTLDTRHSASAASSLKLMLAIYVTAVALMPFSHHDLACHLKSSTHCTTCVAGSGGEAPGADEVLATCCLADAGRPHTQTVPVVVPTILGPSSGRAPPRCG